MQQGVNKKPRMKYRDKIEIIASILQVAASHEATNAKIMYQSSISYTTLREYLSFMLEKGLIFS
jgi:predicted transcriptional regulator